MTDSITAFAPASIGNLAVGFDMLGLALEGVGDHVEAARTGTPGVSITEVRGSDGELHPELSTDPDHNTASIAARALWDEKGDDGGLELHIRKGIPLKSGMGSSAASAVAAVVAVNALLDKPLEHAALLTYALAGERYASGSLHADNVAPSLLGGLVLCPGVLLPQSVALPVPDGVSAVLVHPGLEVSTAESRRGLNNGVSTQQWLDQQGFLAGFIAACVSSDIDLIRRTLKDVIIEPQRAATVACFDSVKDAAMNANALGCSLSGSGPSIFALAEDRDLSGVVQAMENACVEFGIDYRTWRSSLRAPGAHVVSGT